MAGIEFEDDYIEEDSGIDPKQFSRAVLAPTDWTVETIISQLQKGNIEMTPKFQRRDAWSNGRKSRLIESIVLGLPIPQIVLAESKEQRGRFIVLDGKQRLISLFHFASKLGNAFALSGLEVRTDLRGKRFKDFTTDPSLSDDLESFLNYPIRTAVIRNWPSTDFLHTVFLRLNTGSVKLSPQELRQAMFHGGFSDFVDDRAAESVFLRKLFRSNKPDPRMRDVELLTRFLAFKHFIDFYRGRMKSFLDQTCQVLNKTWDEMDDVVRRNCDDFEAGGWALVECLGENQLARKPDSRVFNRAIFDALIYYASDSKIREAMVAHKPRVKTAYEKCLSDVEFQSAIESDTAGVPNTSVRLKKWAGFLEDAIGIEVRVPELFTAASWSSIRTS